jgi:hypothetical protein
MAEAHERAPARATGSPWLATGSATGSVLLASIVALGASTPDAQMFLAISAVVVGR